MSYRSYHLRNSILIYWSYRKDPSCILFLSVMPADMAQKKMMKFGGLGAEIWEFYSRRYFRQDITLVKLSLKMKWCTSVIFIKWGYRSHFIMYSYGQKCHFETLFLTIYKTYCQKLFRIIFPTKNSGSTHVYLPQEWSYRTLKIAKLKYYYIRE